MYCLMKPTLSEEEKQELYESLGYLNKEAREKLIEVNQALVDYNNYLTSDLANLISVALDNIPSTLKPHFGINNHYCMQLIIDDPKHKFPKILLANLDDEFGLYTNPPRIITLDLLDNQNKIDKEKLKDFKRELAPYTLSHELQHDNQVELLNALGQPGVLLKNNPNINHNFSELDAFNYQISNVMAVNFTKAMKNEIAKSADKLTLQEIFHKVTNDLLNDVNTRNPTTAPVFKHLSIGNKHRAYQYAYSQAKHSFVNWYKIYELWYEADRKALQSK